MTSDDATAAVMAGDRTFRVTFGPADEPALAGGPVHLRVVVALLSGGPVQLAESAARATGRSREYAFTANGPDGGPLPDPFADAVEIGGVETFREVTTEVPVTADVLLNQFLELDRVREALPDGGTLQLAVHCRRWLRLRTQADDETAAASAIVHVQMRRDDAELARRFQTAAAAILRAGQFDVARERLLTELVSARSPLAIGALSALLGHSDGYIVARAPQALDALRQPGA
jgi:hypothetical protein